MSPENFLIKIWNNQDGKYFCLATKSINGRWREFFFEKPFKRDVFKRFILMREEDQNLYFCPHGFTQPKRLKEHASTTSYLWSDLDEVNPREINIEPQVAWESSPNRFACLWRLEKPYEKEIAEPKNKSLTYSIGADKGGWDFTQVLRIPGTTNHKYKEKPKGKLLWLKSEILKLSQIKITDPLKVLEDLRSKIKPSTYSLLISKHATVGKRSEVIWKLENDLSEAGISKEQVFLLIKNSVWNKFKDRNDEDRQLKRELDKIREDDEAPLAYVNGHSASKLICMSDVEVEDIEWIWYPYIARGKLTLVEGDPGLGKSWVTMALASYISRGKRLPEQQKSVRGRILLLSAEDGLGDTIRPRLNQLNGDSSQVFAIEGAVHFDEDGAAEVEKYIERIKPDVVVVDPLVAYMGGKVDLHRANETREMMVRLSMIAMKYSCAFLCVRHLTKGGKDKSIYRGLGSIDLTAAARSVILIGRHPDDPTEGRVMCHIKSNLAPMGPSITYSLSKSRQLSPFKWGGVCSLTSKDIMDVEPTGSSERERAKQFLLEILEKEDRKSSEVKTEAEAKGIHVKTLLSVKRELRLKVTYKNDEAIWALHED